MIMPIDRLSLGESNWFRVNVFDRTQRIAGLVVASECSQSALEAIAEPMANMFPGFSYDPLDVMHEVIPLSEVDRDNVITSAQYFWQDGQDHMFVD